MITLSRWFAAEPRSNRLVTFGREGERSDAGLRRDVAALAAHLSEPQGREAAAQRGGAERSVRPRGEGGRDLLLHCDDAYPFAVGLFACARADARILATVAPQHLCGLLFRVLSPLASALGRLEPRR